MKNVNPNLALGCVTALLLAVLVGTFFLTYHGSFTSVAAIGIVTTIVSSGVAALAVLVGVNAGSSASVNATQASVSARASEK
jgi:hypothetical protein